MIRALSIRAAAALALLFFPAAEARAVEELAAPSVPADERTHPLDDLLRRRQPGLGLRVVLVHHHQSHGRLLVMRGNVREDAGSCRPLHPLDGATPRESTAGEFFL